MNIVHVPRGFARTNWGGSETVILEISKQLLKMGHPQAILCTNATADCNFESIDGIGVSRYPYFYPYLGLSKEARHVLDRKGGSPFSFALMRALMRHPQLDVLHLHTGNRIGGIGRYVARKRRIPYVISLHGGVFDVPKEEAQSRLAPARRALEWGKVLGWWVGARQVLQDAAAILCVGYGEYLMAQRHFPEKKVFYVPNGVDAAHFDRGDGAAFRTRYGIPAQARVVLTVGRIDVQKNQLFAVEALPALLQNVPETHLVLVGHVTNEAYYRQIAQTAERLGVQGHLTVIRGLSAGSQELVDAYHAADVFLLPSVHEPFGIVILEAWAAGLPVLATRVGGIPTFVADGQDCMLFAPNDEDGFLQAFLEISRNPTRGSSLAAKGRKKAREDYGWDQIAKQLTGIYEDAICENPLRMGSFS